MLACLHSETSGFVFCILKDLMLLAKLALLQVNTQPFLFYMAKRSQRHSPSYLRLWREAHIGSPKVCLEEPNVRAMFMIQKITEHEVVLFVFIADAPYTRTHPRVRLLFGNAPYNLLCLHHIFRPPSGFWSAVSSITRTALKKL